MADFPKLKTGVVAQYPSDRARTSFTKVYKFLDGLEQRFRMGTTPLKSWLIRLDLLDEAELTAIEEFFVEQSGRFETFSFTDPWDDTIHESCSFNDDSFELRLVREGRGVASVVVRENR